MKTIGILIICVTLAIFGLTYTKNISLAIVATNSMSPTMPQGTLVVTTPASKYEMGEVISYKDMIGRIVTHRIVDIKSYSGHQLYFLKGDANKFLDPYQVKQSEILGKTTTLIPANVLNTKVFTLVAYTVLGFLLGKLVINFLKVFDTI